MSEIVVLGGWVWGWGAVIDIRVSGIIHMDLNAFDLQKDILCIGLYVLKTATQYTLILEL